MTEDFDYTALTTMGEGEEPSSRIRSLRVYDGRGFFVTVKLSELANSVICEHDYEDGRPPQRGLFIPFNDSGLFVSPKKNVMLTCKMEAAQLASQHHTHLLSQVVDRDVAAEWRRLGFNQGFVGFARPIGTEKRRGR